MRLKITTLAFLTATSGAADASSFAFVAPPSAGQSPSITEIGLPRPTSPRQPDVAAAQPDSKGAALAPLTDPLPQAPAAPTKFLAISPSVVAVENAMPPVTSEKVAAIGRPHLAPQPKPLVIRGGIAGDAFTQRAEPVVVPQAAANDGKADTPRQNKRENRRKREAPQQPTPAAPAPAKSTRQFAVPG
ncbi:hypothetical protein [Mesorhizobium sp. CN2-181]|uniref:hypothetical protein n=1 Tax=Mesorhizobium yinganensis TaxID=3157707 RepID=UPI0032B7DF76